jgi:hypothetical protein
MKTSANNTLAKEIILSVQMLFLAIFQFGVLKRKGQKFDGILPLNFWLFT